MKEKAVDYFHKNKDAMNVSDMVRYLRQEGVSERDIEEAKTAVFEHRGGSPSESDYDELWNLCKKKTYAHAYQKLADFILGLFGFSLPIYLFVYLNHLVGFILAWAIYIVQIFGIFYFWNRRRFVSIGSIIASIFIPMVLFGVFLWFWRF
ncbi:MAG: hypothetical protein WC878_06935 [Candidatus Paceibacterota bacterium]|jgi:hypothetical protein